MSNWQFWTLKTGWPADRGGNVFFGRAVNEIGQLLFGARWTGKEPAATETSPDTMRLRLVQLAIRDALAEGVLVSVLRPEAGGEFSGPQPASHWNTETVAPRFAYCMIDPQHPFSAGVAGKGCQYIFITRESLDAFKLSRQNSPAEAPQKKPHVGGNVREFKVRLKKIFMASPTRRTAPKKELLRIAKDEFDLSGKQALKARLDVLDDVSPDIRRVWEGPGRSQLGSE